MPSLSPSSGRPTRQLTMFDAACMIVGIIIGAGIFHLPPLVAASLPSASWILAVWLIGGLLALLGALCYAELTTTYPEPGGDYVYLSHAYGSRCGFLFVWAEFWIIRPGSTGPMAFIFGKYFQQLVPLGTSHDTLIYAASAIVAVTLVNMLGVRTGKWTQNLLTVIKVLALLAVFVAAFAASTPVPKSPANNLVLPPLSAVSLALLWVMFCFGGWNDVAFLAAEVRRPEKNLLGSLLLGTIVVTLIYVLVNLAYLRVLGVEGLAGTTTPATDMMGIAHGNLGERLISALICVSALGAINGMIFTGARVYYAMGSKLANFRWLAHWNKRQDAPIRAIGLQSLVILGMVVGFGLQKHDFVSLVIFTAPCFWLFLLLVGISLFLLRWRDADRERPFRVPAYPLVPAIFCLGSLFMFYSTTRYMLGQLVDPEMIENPAFQAILVVTGLVVVAGLGLAMLKQEE